MRRWWVSGVLALVTGVTGRAEATCVGGCSAHPEVPLGFWPSAKPLVVQGACSWSCSAPGGPVSSSALGAKELVLTEVVPDPAQAKAVHGFVAGPGAGEFLFKGPLKAAKVYTTHFEGGPGTPDPFVVADARIEGVFSASASLVHGGKTFLADGAKITVTGGARLVLEKGHVEADTGTELVLEGGGVRVLKGGVRASDVAVSTAAGKTMIAGRARVTVDGKGTRISVWSGAASHEGKAIAAGKGMAIAAGKKGGAIAALPADPPPLTRDLVLTRADEVPLTALLPTGHVHVRAIAAGAELDVVADDPAVAKISVKPALTTLFVTSLDAAGLESVEGAPQTLQVARIQFLDRVARPRSVFYPDVALCKLDAAPFAVDPAHELFMMPGQSHLLSCKRSAEGPVATLAIDAKDAGRVHFQVQVDPGATPKQRKLFVRLEADGGASLHGAVLTITGPQHATVSPIEEVVVPNSYSVWRSTVTWTSAEPPVLTFAVPGTQHAIPIK